MVEHPMENMAIFKSPHNMACSFFPQKKPLYMSQGVLFLLLGCENLPIKVKVELVL
jgi:hypothetical protein